MTFNTENTPEGLTALPAGWAISPIGKLCDTVEQKNPKDQITFTYIDIGSIDRNKKKITSPQIIEGTKAPSRARRVVQSGDTIVALTRPNLNSVALVPQEFDGQIASTGFEVLRSRWLDPRWIGYVVRTNTFVESMSNAVQGALYPAIRSQDVKSFTIPVAPVAEQRRIADKLDSLLERVDAASAHLSNATALLKRFRQSIIDSTTSGNLVRIKEKSTTITDKNKNTIGSIKTDIRYGTSKKCSPEKIGFPVLRIPNIANLGKLNLQELKYAELKQDEYEKISLKKGDLLTIRSNGSVDLVGKTSIVDENSQGMAYAGYLIRIRLDHKKAIPEFVNYCLSTTGTRLLIEAMARSTSGVNNINSQELCSIPVYLPPIEEQAEIVRRVEALFALADQLEARIAKAQALTERLTPALLAKAFRGELVPQDPDDEPASELLRRLRESREAAAKPGRKPKRSGA